MNTHAKTGSTMEKRKANESKTKQMLARTFNRTIFGELVVLRDRCVLKGGE